MAKESEIIRATLTRNKLTHVWLINRLNEAGVRTDKTEFSSVLNGTRIGPKADTILSTALSILTKYEEAMAL